MSRTEPRRRSERRSERTSERRSRRDAVVEAAAPSSEAVPERLGGPRVAAVLWALVVLAGAGALACAVAEIGPSWTGAAGSVTVATAYAWGVAVRSGGRPAVAAVLALGLGLAAVLSGDERLRSGAAALTGAVAAVLAVVATVPAARLLGAAREVLVAAVIAAVGALAVVGFDPVVRIARFEYATLALALLGALAVVHRLGAGFHGLGRRGLFTVAAGTVVLAVTLAYAELLRRYGTPGLVDVVADVVAWCRSHLGASPRPLESVLGVPALLWGVHMRSRRRQGWWVCVFGVAATASIAHALVNPAITDRESALSVLYGLVVGLVLGSLLIRIDLALTAPRGRRGRRTEAAAAVRPEPTRISPLL